MRIGDSHGLSIGCAGGEIRHILVTMVLGLGCKIAEVLQKLELHRPSLVNFWALRRRQKFWVGITAIKVLEPKEPVHMVYSGSLIDKLLVRHAKPLRDLANSALDVVT